MIVFTKRKYVLLWLCLLLTAAHVTSEGTKNDDGTGSPSPTTPAPSAATGSPSQAPTISPAPSVSFAPTSNSTTTTAPTAPPSLSPAPSAAPTTNATASSPAPSASPSTHAPTVAPVSPAPSASPTLSPSASPSAAPHKKNDHHKHHHRPSIWRILAKTLAWLIMIALGVLAFGACMSNRYRIYYYLRGAWYTFLRLDCTRTVIRKLRLERFFGGDGYDSSLNEIIFDNDLNEGLLMQDA